MTSRDRRNKEKRGFTIFEFDLESCGALAEALLTLPRLFNLLLTSLLLGLICSASSEEDTKSLREQS